MQSMYYGVDEVEQVLQISKSKSYTLIRKLNEELKQKGFQRNIWRNVAMD